MTEIQKACTQMLKAFKMDYQTADMVMGSLEKEEHQTSMLNWLIEKYEEGTKITRQEILQAVVYLVGKKKN